MHAVKLYSHSAKMLRTKLCPTCRRVKTGPFEPRLYYMVSAEGMIKNCATDRRYHDVDDARMDEMMDLISQLRAVFSIVGK